MVKSKRAEVKASSKQKVKRTHQGREGFKKIRVLNLSRISTHDVAVVALRTPLSPEIHMNLYCFRSDVHHNQALILSFFFCNGSAEELAWSVLEV